MPKINKISFKIFGIWFRSVVNLKFKTIQRFDSSSDLSKEK